MGPNFFKRSAMISSRFLNELFWVTELKPSVDSGLRRAEGEASFLLGESKKQLATLEDSKRSLMEG